MKNSFLSVRILGSGSAQPHSILTSEAIDLRSHAPVGTTFRKSGVLQRFVASHSDTSASLGAQAALKALASAGLTLSDIDCIVTANATADQGLPHSAALLHYELGLLGNGTPALDVNASCLGFIAAFDLFSWLVQAGKYQRVLIVSTDLASVGLNWDVLESSAIFGDGSAAVIIGASASESSRVLSADFKVYSQGVDLCKIQGGGSRFHPSRITGTIVPAFQFQMDGPSVFKMATQYLPDFLEELLSKAGIDSVQDLDWIVPHQASHLALKHMVKRLHLDPNKVVNIFENHGNQVAASLPTALDIAVKDQRIQRGDTILLLGTGAGLSLGGMVVVY